LRTRITQRIKRRRRTRHATMQQHRLDAIILGRALDRLRQLARRKRHATTARQQRIQAGFRAQLGHRLR
jgi:hypothetical protein